MSLFTIFPSSRFRVAAGLALCALVAAGLWFRPGPRHALASIPKTRTAGLPIELIPPKALDRKEAESAVVSDPTSEPDLGADEGEPDEDAGFTIAMLDDMPVLP